MNRPALSTQPTAQLAVLAYEYLLISLTGFGGNLQTRFEHIAVSKLFTLNLPATDMPGDRDELLLVQVLQDREGVLRILQLLLSGEEGSADDLASAAAGATAGSFRGTYVGHPLLESLLRALHSSPRRLEEIDRLVADLLRTEKGRALMPEGLESIWAPVREAWLVMRGERRAVPPGNAP